MSVTRSRSGSGTRGGRWNYRQRVTDYACHERARAFFAPTNKKRKKSWVARESDGEGGLLPTAKERDFVYRLSQLKRFDLPLGWDRELWFVRCFIGVFASGKRRADPSRVDVRRRCNVARDLAFDNRSRFELCAKFGIGEYRAEILIDYGQQCAARRAEQRRTLTWDNDDEAELEEPYGEIVDLDGERGPPTREWFDIEEDEPEFTSLHDALDVIMAGLTEIEPTDDDDSK